MGRLVARATPCFGHGRGPRRHAAVQHDNGAALHRLEASNAPRPPPDRPRPPVHPTTLLAVLLLRGAVAWGCGRWPTAPRLVPDCAGWDRRPRLLPVPARPEPGGRQLSQPRANPRRPGARGAADGPHPHLHRARRAGPHPGTGRRAAAARSRSAPGWTAAPAANARELAALVQTARANPNVDRVLVGNEALLRGDLTPAQLVAAIAQVRRGVGVPVSTAEPWHVWLAHPELAQRGGLHHHPPPALLGRAAGGRRPALRAWRSWTRCRPPIPASPSSSARSAGPADGVDIGAARASRVDQAAFLRGFFVEAARRHLDYFVMEAFDQPWKTSFEGRAAGYWGMHGPRPARRSGR